MNAPGEERSLFEYTLDAADCIATVSPEWVAFACENEAKDLTPDRVIGRPLIAFISDEETRLIYNVLLNKVRMTGIGLTVKFRCDSPTLRRFMELEIQPGAEGFLRLTARLLRAESRDAIALLNVKQPRNDEILTMCSWCKGVRLGEEWVEVEEAIEQMQLFDQPRLPRLSHGICPKCDLRMREEFGIAISV